MSSIYFGRCELRHDTREVLVDGSLCPVRRRVFDLMAYLIAQRPRAVPHAELLREFWPGAGASPKVLARAILEARRVCEAVPEDPQLFVSVHGVGYRFAGVLSERPAEPSAAAVDAGSVGEMRDLAAQATAAMRAARFEQAQTLAQRALVQAGQLQSQSERVAALALCSEVALRTGTAEAAAKLAAQALQVARGEGHSVLVARARMAVAMVHLLEGDAAIAVETLEECRKVFAAAGHEADLLTCSVRLADSFRRHGNPQAGLVLCRNAQVLAQKLGAEYESLALRANEVGLLGHLAEVLGHAGQAAEASATQEQALAAARSLLNDLAPSGYAHLHQLVLMHTSILLVDVGQLEEALELQKTVDRTFESLGPTLGPLLRFRKGTSLRSRADILSRLGRHEEAIKLVQELADPASDCQASSPPNLLCETSRVVYHRAGRLEQALSWAVKEVQALHEMYPSQANRLTSILEAELNAGELQKELVHARQRHATLAEENAALRARVAAMQGTVPVSPDTGLAAPQLLGTVFGAALAHAHARGLPMCVGLLALGSAADEANEHSPQAMNTLLKRVAELLREHPDIGQPAVHVGHGQVAFRIREAGPARATEVCAAVREQLCRQEWFLLGLGVAPAWQCAAADATRFGSIEACIAQLAARGQDEQNSAPATASQVLASAVPEKSLGLPGPH